METVGLAPEMAEPLPGAAVRRPAAARRRRPRAGRRPAGPADGRAVQRGRPGRAREPAGRAAAAAGRAGQDDRVRHPRHRRGRQARRQGRGAAGGRQARPVRRAAACCSPGRPTTSSTTSWAATAATAGWLPVLGARSPLRRAAAPSRSASSRAADAGLDAGRRRRRAARRAGSTPPRPAAGRRRTRATSCRGGSLYDVGRRLAAQRARRGAVLAVRAGSRSTSDGRGRRRRSAPTTCCARSTTPAAHERGLRSAHDLGARATSTASGSCCCSTSLRHTADPHRARARDPAGLARQPQRRAPQHAAQRLGAALHGPSLALFVLLPPLLGTGILNPANVIVALTIYTVALLVRTVADGLAAVPSAVVNSATAMGYTPAAPVRRRRAADGRPGDPRRAPGGGGVERSAWSRSVR